MIGQQIINRIILSLNKSRLRGSRVKFYRPPNNRIAANICVQTETKGRRGEGWPVREGSPGNPSNVPMSRYHWTSFCRAVGAEHVMNRARLTAHRVHHCQNQMHHDWASAELTGIRQIGTGCRCAGTSARAVLAVPRKSYEPLWRWSNAHPLP